MRTFYGLNHRSTTPNGGRGKKVSIYQQPQRMMIYTPMVENLKIFSPQKEHDRKIKNKIISKKINFNCTEKFQKESFCAIKLNCKYEDSEEEEIPHIEVIDDKKSLFSENSTSQKNQEQDNQTIHSKNNNTQQPTQNLRASTPPFLSSFNSFAQLSQLSISDKVNENSNEFQEQFHEPTFKIQSSNMQRLSNFVTHEDDIPTFQSEIINTPDKNITLKKIIEKKGSFKESPNLNEHKHSSTQTQEQFSFQYDQYNPFISFQNNIFRDDEVSKDDDNAASKLEKIENMQLSSFNSYKIKINEFDRNNLSHIKQPIQQCGQIEERTKWAQNLAFQTSSSNYAKMNKAISFSNHLPELKNINKDNCNNKRSNQDISNILNEQSSKYLSQLIDEKNQKQLNLHSYLLQNQREIQQIKNNQTPLQNIHEKFIDQTFNLIQNQRQSTYQNFSNQIEKRQKTEEFNNRSQLHQEREENTPIKIKRKEKSGIAINCSFISKSNKNQINSNQARKDFQMLSSTLQNYPANTYSKSISIKN